ncbi:SAV_915 family protein [Peterkaempfera sp. SMS 1(5)a]|uniref:SAV_915 family protein n=1 Tax=Peterkaempfera podocarpi TaxID=3232308 RepID=UPI00366E21C8
MKSEETPSPEPLHPARHALLHVPVRTSGGCHALRLFRGRDGSRCAVAFSSPELLTALLGPDQKWILLAEAPLRAMAEPLGARTLVLDPQLVAPPVPTAAPAPAPAPVATGAPVTVGAPAPTAAGCAAVPASAAVPAASSGTGKQPENDRYWPADLVGAARVSAAAAGATALFQLAQYLR